MTVPISNTNSLFVDLLLRVIALEVYCEITVELDRISAASHLELALRRQALRLQYLLKYRYVLTTS
jgi:hypothetical protein